jgi:hypothetical protein
MLHGRSGPLADRPAAVLKIQEGLVQESITGPVVFLASVDRCCSARASNGCEERLGMAVDLEAFVLGGRTTHL